MLYAFSPFLALFGLGGLELAVIIAIFGMIFGGIMGIAGMYFEHQRKKLAHEVARLALEKGQPVPSQFAGEEHRLRSAADSNHHDLRGGLVLIGVGVGVYLFLGAVSSHSVALLGAVPGFIGVALVLNWILLRLLNRKQDTPPPPAA